MKLLFILLLALISLSSLAQKRQPISIKHSAEEVTPYLLAKKITASSKNEKEKVEAIFEWITRHISYNTGIFYTIPRKAPILYPAFQAQDTGALPPLNDRVAENVLRRRVAVCEGYARLFASLCAHAGIKAELIIGYARSGRNGEAAKFRSNHTWNAVMIDSTWYLLDATWASGFIASGSNDYVQHYNPQYFLTPPKEFSQDHYPEDLQWTLLTNPPALKEFSTAPFKYKAFLKYKIASYAPASGVIEINIGDTIKIELETGVREKKLVVTTDAISDSLLNAFSTNPHSAAIVSGDKVSYYYATSEEDGAWLHVIYENEPVLRYQLVRKKNPAPSLAGKLQNLK